MILKKGMAVIAALAIGVGSCPGGVTAEAAQKEEIKKEDAGSWQEREILNQALSSETDWDKAYEFLSGSVSGDPEMNLALLDPKGMKTLGEDSEEADLSGDADYKEGELAGDDDKDGRDVPEVKTLQMPQKLEVTIDPWEVDGKGQIYSEQYVIRNTGDKTGMMTLSGLTCRPQEGSGVSVRTNRDGIHEDERKSIYMEMLFGTGERIVLSEEGSEYQTELKPGEEVTLEFSGEVNERASGEWDNRDVAVEVIYSWKIKEGAADTSGDAVDDASGDASGDMPKGAEEGTADASGDAAVEPEPGEQESSVGGSKAEQTEFLEDDGLEEPKAVDIDLSKDGEIRMDSWTADGNGNLVSIQYVMCNTGNVPGTLKLCDSVYRLADENGTNARMKMSVGEKPKKLPESDGERKPQEAEGLESTGRKSIWIELTAEEGETSVTEQGNLEASEYETELELGEELIIYFYVSPEGIAAEELKDGKASVTVGYSWEQKEEARLDYGREPDKMPVESR